MTPRATGDWSVCRERTIVIARSTFAGSGHHGSHWLGDNDSTWADLYVCLVLPLLRAVLRSFPVGEQVSVHAGTVGDEHVRHHTRGCGHLWLRRHDDTGVVPTMAAAGCLLPVQPQPQRDQQPTPGTWPRMVPPITMSNAPCLQDPAAFGAEFAANVRDVLLIRYRLIPFLYSLFHRSYALGGTVARPLMFEFTSDVNTYAIDKQMLWGESFLITPVLEVQ